MLALDPEHMKGLVIVPEAGTELEYSYRKFFDMLWESGSEFNNKSRG